MCVCVYIWCLSIHSFIYTESSSSNSGLPALVLRMIQSLRERTNGIAGLPLVKSVGPSKAFGQTRCM